MKRKYKQGFRALVVLLVVAGMLLMPLAAFAEAPDGGGSGESADVSTGSGGDSGGGGIDTGSSGGDTGSGNGIDNSGSSAGDTGNSDSGASSEPPAGGNDEGQPPANDNGGSDDPEPAAPGDQSDQPDEAAGEEADPDDPEAGDDEAAEADQDEEAVDTDEADPDDPEAGDDEAAGADQGEEDGDCYVVTITEVDDDFDPIETPGLVINGGTDGKETNLDIRFEEVGNSNIATLTVKIPGGFVWDPVNLEIKADLGSLDETGRTEANWYLDSYDDTTQTLSLYGDALFKGGWVSAILMGITTPDTPGIYEFETSVQAIETFSDGSPIYDFDQADIDEHGHVEGTMRYRDNNLAVGHDQPTLWVAGNEVNVGSLGVQAAIDSANPYDVVTLNSDRTEDQINLNKSIYLRGAFEAAAPTITLLGVVDGGPGVVISGAGNDVFINNLTLKQNQLPTYDNYHYEERILNLEYGITIPFIGFISINESVQIPLELELIIASGGGIADVVSSLLSDLNIPKWIIDGVVNLATDLIQFGGVDESIAHLTDKDNWSFDFKYVEDYMINASNLNSLAMENVNVQGAGRIYHTFDVEEVLKIAVFDMAFEVIDLGSLGFLVVPIGSLLLGQDPGEVDWLALLDSLQPDIDFQSLLASGVDIGEILLSSYNWGDAIGGVNLNGVNYANLSNVNVEKFSRNGISFTDVPTVFMSDITVKNTGSHLGSAGVAFYGDIRDVSFGGGTIKQAPIGINVGALDMHGWHLEHLGNLFGCPCLPVYIPEAANITLRNINFEQNLVGVMNLGGLVDVNGQTYYSPNFFNVDARCNNWSGNLFNTLGLVKSCGLAPECVKPDLPDKPVLTLTAHNKSKTYNGLPFTAFTFGVSGVHDDYDYNLDTMGHSFGPAQGAINVGGYAIQPSGFSSLNYIIEYVDAVLSINAAQTGPTGPTGPFEPAGPFGFDIPFTPFLPGGTGGEEAPGLTALTLAPEAPLVNPGDYLVIPPDDPETELIPMVDVPFVEEGTREELDEVIAAYEVLYEYFEEYWEEMTDEEYAKHLLDLSAAWAAIQLREAALAMEAGEEYDLDAVAEAADLAMEHFGTNGEYLNAEQEAAFTTVMDAVAEMLASMSEESAA